MFLYTFSHGDTHLIDEATKIQVLLFWVQSQVVSLCCPTSKEVLKYVLKLTSTFNGFYNRVISSPSFRSEICLNDVKRINFSVSLNAIGLLLVDMFLFSFVPNHSSIMRI